MLANKKPASERTQMQVWLFHAVERRSDVDAAALVETLTMEAAFEIGLRTFDMGGQCFREAQAKRAIGMLAQLPNAERVPGGWMYQMTRTRVALWDVVLRGVIFGSVGNFPEYVACLLAPIEYGRGRVDKDTDSEESALRHLVGDRLRDLQDTTALHLLKAIHRYPNGRQRRVYRWLLSAIFKRIDDDILDRVFDKLKMV